MTSRPALHELAEYRGLVPTFLDWRGHLRSATDETLETLLAAMRVDASTEEAARRSMEVLRERESAVTPIAILRPEDRVVEARNATPPYATGEHDCEVVLRDPCGETVRTLARVRFEHGRTCLALPPDVEVSPGYYEAKVGVDVAWPQRTFDWFVLAPPERCVSVRERCGRDRAFGVMLNLYSLRSPENWGIGDLSDVTRASRELAGLGARFIGLSPLHATANRGSGINPYYPSSRLFFNWIYLDVEAVPELSTSATARGLLESNEFRAALARCRAGDRVNHFEIARRKKEVLLALHGDFRRLDPSSPRRLEYGDYRTRTGEELDAHATYEALADRLSPEGPETPDWRRWPAAYRDRASEATREFARREEEHVDFYRWMQFELDRQLASSGNGLGLGLFCDLAVGTAPGGAEVWGDSAAFAEGVVLGAPPDDYSDQGQSWGSTPLLPHALRATRYRHLRRLLSANFRHAGVLRIDHAMGLVRQFWVPEDRTAAHGGYVAFPAEEMFAVLAIESLRARAVVVAEDLGTVPEGFRDDLMRRGCLRTQVLYFERDHRGEFRAPEEYATDALATINTHDLPPLRGFWTGIDLRLRDAAGALDRGVTLADALARREQEKAAMRRRFEACGESLGGSPSTLTLCGAGARMLAASPARLVAIGLDDLGEEELPVNVPSLVLSEAPLWARRMRMSVGDILDAPTARALIEATVGQMDPSAAAVEVPIDGCLDLHTFRPSEIGTLIPEYLAECRKRGLREVRIVHGKGRGNLRRGVEAVLARTPGVAEWRSGHSEEGAWGVTIVTLADANQPPQT